MPFYKNIWFPRSLCIELLQSYAENDFLMNTLFYKQMFTHLEYKHYQDENN